MHTHTHTHSVSLTHTWLSLCCAPVNIMTLLIRNTPILNKKFLRMTESIWTKSKKHTCNEWGGVDFNYFRQLASLWRLALESEGPLNTAVLGCSPGSALSFFWRSWPLPHIWLAAPCRSLWILVNRHCPVSPIHSNTCSCRQFLSLMSLLCSYAGILPAFGGPHLLFTC